MANKKVSQLTSKPSVLVTDIVPIADPTSGQLFKTTLSALGAVIGSAVASVNGLVGVVVLDTDDIQELASPTNRWYTDTRSRAAISGGTGISYNSGTGVITSSVTLASLGGVPTSRTLTINGTTLDLSADRSFTINSMVYPGAGIAVSNGSAWATSITDNSGNWNTAFSWGNHAGLYLPIGGGTLTGALSGTSATFSSNITANSFVKSGGTSSQFLKADGSVDIRTFVTTGALDNYLPLTGGALTNSLSSGYVLSVTNTTEAAGANGLYVNIASGSTGTPFRVDRGGVSLITVNYLGASLFKSTITANQFIKASGTSSEFLMADGSVSTGALGSYLPLSGGTLTGALSGTSASFSGNVTSGGAVENLFIANGNTYSGFKLNRLGVSKWAMFNNNAGADAFDIYNYTTNSSNFTIASTGAATFSSSVTATKFVANGSGTNDLLYLDAGINTDFAFKIQAAANDVLTLRRQHSTLGNLDIMSFGFNGNVGIGTTAPGVALEINGASNVASRGRYVKTSEGILQLGANRGTSNCPYIGSENAYDFAFITNDVERMRITSGGNVLIGTTSSANVVFAFQVGNGGADTRALFQPNNPYSIGLANGASSFWYIGVNAQTAANGLQFYSNELGSAAMTIRTSGNVGIGTTAPAFPLDVETGSGRIQIRTGGATGGTGGGNGLASVNSASNALADLNIRANVITLITDATERMRITAGGNVLIGTTSDNGYKLQVNGSMSASAFFESSDKTIKTLIEDNYQSKGIESVTAKLYTKNGVTELGYYAQDVQAILPSAVNKGNDGLLSLSYREVHTAKIARLEKEVEELKAQLNLI